MFQIPNSTNQVNTGRVNTSTGVPVDPPELSTHSPMPVLPGSTSVLQYMWVIHTGDTTNSGLFHFYHPLLSLFKWCIPLKLYPTIVIDLWLIIKYTSSTFLYDIPIASHPPKPLKIPQKPRGRSRGFRHI